MSNFDYWQHIHEQTQKELEKEFLMTAIKEYCDKTIKETIERELSARN